MIFSRKTFVALLVIVLISLLVGWIWQLNTIPIATGEVPLIVEQPYHQLSYIKLSPDHGGNFTGDVYVYDLGQNSTTQLTKGGTTSNAQWVDSQQMLIAYRPRGSVVDLYYLDVNTAKLDAANQQDQNLFFGNDLTDPSFSPNRDYYALKLPPAENAQNTEYAIAHASADEGETIKTITSTGFPSPAWVPNSSVLIYSKTFDEFCLLNAESLEEVCRSGLFSTVSESIQPNLVAFIEKRAGSFQVCTAEIKNLTFVNAQCHDQSKQQITNLAWRP